MSTHHRLAVGSWASLASPWTSAPRCRGARHLWTHLSRCSWKPTICQVSCPCGVTELGGTVTREKVQGALGMQKGPAWPRLKAKEDSLGKWHFSWGFRMKRKPGKEREKRDSRWKNQHLQSSWSEKRLWTWEATRRAGSQSEGTTGQVKHREVGRSSRQHWDWCPWGEMWSH